MRAVVMPLMDLDEFDKDTARRLCSEASPGYITRTISDLVSDAFLARVEIDGRETYRWTERKPTFEPESWIRSHVHGVQVKRTPESERPREKLARVGVENLTPGELLAILIRSGIRGESAIIGGQKLANHFGDRIEDLRKMAVTEVRQITPAVNIANYAQIMAGIELGRRIAIREHTAPPVITKITSTAEAVRYCEATFARLAADGVQEEFHIATLDTKHKPIATHRITVGTLDASLVHPREVFRPAIRDAASAVLLIHNHPSGDPTPSREDINVTDHLTEVGKLIGIQVLDHIIVARRRCLSIREEG